MSEELLKAIVRLFAIVAKERITEDERANIQEFISVHVNQDAATYYLKTFDQYCVEYEVVDDTAELKSEMDDDTLEFIGEWSKILEITKSVNTALTKQQKVYLVIKIIELVYADGKFSDRQSNLVFYIAEALKINSKDVGLLKRFVMGEDPEDLADRSIMIIDESSGNYLKGTHHLHSKELTGFMAVLRLSDIETYFVKYLGISRLTLNGQILRSRKISVLPTGSTLRGNKIQTVYYSNIVSRFLHANVENNVSFKAEHVFYHFKSGKAGLQNVSLAEQGGKLIGLMGASGSGKSTLLNVLNGTERPSSGRVYINGINIHEEKHKIEGVIGYVPQDDLLIEELTVFQNLYYASKLCFGNYTKLQLNELVNKVLTSLGLYDTRNLKVGSPMDKTISGGQRKRLNIGLELLREPTVLFVDEPTSGLSSRDSENIMDLLKELSLRGKMVFVVIHQPSSDIYKMFDNLLILDVGGYQIYYGNPIEAVVYFKEIMDSVDKTEGTCPECGNINPEQIFNIIETRIVDEMGKFTNTRKVSPGQWYQYFRSKITIPEVRTIKEKLHVTQQIPSWFKQLGVFIKRDVLAKLANKQYLAINLMEAPLLALFMAFLVRYYSTLEMDNAGYSFSENDNIPIYFFMSIIVALFMGLTVSAEEIYRDRQILKREKFLNLSKSSYLVSKVTVLFVISAIQACSFVLIGNWILGIHGMGLWLWLIMFSTACFANLLGLNISASFNSAVTIYILIPILLIPQLMLSGVVVSFDKFNPSVSASDGVPLVGDMMASRWAFEASVVAQFKYNKHNKRFFELDKRMAQAEYKKLYYIPAIESELSYVLNNMNRRLSGEAAKLSESLELIYNEISYELKVVGEDKFQYLDRLTIRKFDSITYRHTADFLGTLKTMYSNRYNKAEKEKNTLIAIATDEPEKAQVFYSMRDQHSNQAINDMVNNRGTAQRVIKVDNQLVQKIYPIFFGDFRPTNSLGFQSKFLTSEKMMLNKKYDTLIFNLSVIWTMTMVLYFTVYFDVLKRAINMVTTRKSRFRKKE